MRLAPGARMTARGSAPSTLVAPSAENAVESASRELREESDLDPLVEALGGARVVLIGEASHGTSEFYSWRARISRRLIIEHGFDFVAVEGDWPEIARLDAYSTGRSGGDAIAALRGLDRWPAWMWANWEIAAFAAWLRELNAGRERPDQVRMYGLDVYSLWSSMEAVLGYLQENRPQAVESARRALRCFEPYGEDPQLYAQNAALVPDDCREEVAEVLLQLLRDASEDGADGGEGLLDAQQNARVMVEAERYYRAMLHGAAASWNVRDRHMQDTLERLLDRHGQTSKGIVWAHNTHVGDARATDMTRDGMVNIGQLARERFGGDTRLVGFGSYRGTVVAARSWGAELERMRVPEAREGSVEHLLHELGGDRLLLLHDHGLREALHGWRDHRAIGVVYRPQFEHFGNYVPTVLPERYDAFIHIDESHALHPLHGAGEAGPPQTYPWGF